MISKKGKTRVRSLLSVVMCSATLFSAFTARADAPKVPAAQLPIVLVHQALTAQDLPNPQATMVLKFTLANTHDLDRPVRALVSRDGRLMDVQLSKSYLNEKEQPTYEFAFNAPFAEIVYEFLAYDKSGGAITSQLYGVRRTCLPPIDQVDTNVDPKMQPEARLQAQYVQSQQLGTELQQYDRAIATLKNLEGMLKE